MNNKSPESTQRTFFTITAFLATLGLILSIYSTAHHMEVRTSGATGAFCNINDFFSCDDVAKSDYAEILGIPLGIWGSGFFFAQLVLVAFLLIRPGERERFQGPLTLSMIVGFASSVILGIISWTQIGTMCLNCIGVYFVTFLQIALLVYFKKQMRIDSTMMQAGQGFMVFAISVVGVIGVYRLSALNVPRPGQKVTAPKSQEIEQERSPLVGISREIKVDRSPYSGLGEDFRKGNDQAKVVIVEFADFECPACAHASQQLNRLSQMYGQDVQVVFKNYPLDASCNDGIKNQIHQHACTAAIAARCAGMSGKFWPMHDQLFENQRNLSPDKVISLATEIGLNKDDFKACMDSKDVVNKIKDDVKMANELNISGTPTVFFNGKLWAGPRSLDALQREVDRVLQEQ